MNLTPYQIINFIVILVVMVILVRYAWSVMFDKHYQPEAWRNKIKKGEVSGDLIKLEKKYADKVRFFNWWFQIDRIQSEKIPGAFAELGVYKGDSALLIHKMAPDRNFYLFDTFSGFTEDDLKTETGEAAKYKASDFADTSLEKVKKRLGNSEKLIFRKGYFPETTEALGNEGFAFVNMDADLYKPTRAGLEFFYPRLSPGGVIIIHDHTHKWEGILKAVEDFVNTIPETLVMLPDMDGTVMIFKNGNK